MLTTRRSRITHDLCGPERTAHAAKQPKPEANPITIQESSTFCVRDEESALT
jgi:hypothetical protein